MLQWKEHNQDHRDDVLIWAEILLKKNNTYCMIWSWKLQAGNPILSNFPAPMQQCQWDVHCILRWGVGVTEISSRYRHICSLTLELHCSCISTNRWIELGYEFDSAILRCTDLGWRMRNAVVAGARAHTASNRVQVGALESGLVPLSRCTSTSRIASAVAYFSCFTPGVAYFIFGVAF